MAKKSPFIKDITGKQFGYLTAIEPTEKRQGSNVIWKLKCVCGNYVEKVISVLSETSSCGCMKDEGLKRKHVIPGKTDLVTVRPDLAAEWDYEKNGLVRPENRTENSMDVVWWICPKGHSYRTSIVQRTRQGTGCHFCKGYKVISGENDLATLRPELLSEWDYEKNDLIGIAPNQVFLNSQKKVFWKCPKGHSYEMKVGYRSRSTYGCPYCNNFLALPGYNDIASQYPEIAEKEWDYEKNKLCPNQVVAESGKKAWWLCAKGHSYQQAIDNHVKIGQGCPYCANKRVLQGYNDVTTTHPDLVKEWSEKNRKKPEECIAGSHQRIVWKCKDCGNEWSAPIKSRAYSKQGCPKCALAYKTSEPEQALFYYLHKAFPSAVNSYKAEWLGRMEIDVYIPELQVGIEFDGGKWHRNLDKDIRKNALLHERGIKLIRVRDERNPSIDDGSIIVSATRDIDKSLIHMEPVVKRLFESINEICGISIKADIDIQRDLNEIQSLFDAKKKGRSVASNPEQLAEWNREKNSINPERVSERSHRKVWWKCSICGTEWQSPPHTKNGTGCITCRRSAAGHTIAIRKANRGNSKRIIEYENLMQEWCYEKNSVIIPSELTHGSEQKVWWKCKMCGNEWQAAIKERARRGRGCPKCARKRHRKD